MTFTPAETIAIDMRLTFNSSATIVELGTQLDDGLLDPLDYARKVMHLWDKFQQEILSYT